jgi:SAM-dependent methyltransferase
MEEGKFYGGTFFKDLSEGSYKSAKVMVPELIKIINPKSVIDIGCGLGAWLKVFEENGIKEIFGIDGEYVNTSNLIIDKSKFLKHDLKQSLSIDKKYDLCISLEVAEHLPKESAESFVESLIKLSDVVVFSAAIPMQLGTHHINEQYPEYWANIFANKGYVVSDCIRPIFWNNENVSYWFKQNMLVFVKSESLINYPQIKLLAEKTNKDYLTKVHPGIFEHKRFFRWAHFTLYTFSKLTGIKMVNY